jgi:hypothetical protein
MPEGRRSAVSWISGGCWNGPDEVGGPENLPLRMIRLEVASALAQMEEAGVNLEYHADDLPTNSLEHAALTERAEAITKELYWLREQLTGLAQRAASGPV